MNGVSVLVAKHLNFNVARFAQIPLHVERIITKGCLGFRSGRGNGVIKLATIEGHLHAASAATSCRLDKDRIANVLSDFCSRRSVCQSAVRSGHDGNAELLHCLLGRNLVAHHSDVLCSRPDEGDAVFFNNRHEIGVL